MRQPVEESAKERESIIVQYVFEAMTIVQYAVEAKHARPFNEKIFGHNQLEQFLPKVQKYMCIHNKMAVIPYIISRNWWIQ